MPEPDTPGSPEVASALLRLSAGDFGEASRRLYEALLGASLLVGVTGPAPEADDDPPIKLVAAPDDTGEPRLLTFASPRSFELGGQAGPFAVAPATGLCGFALRNGLTRMSIDSGGPVSATLERWELEALSGGRIPRVPRRRLTMSPVGADVVPGLAEVLEQVFPARSVLLLEERSDEEHLLLGLVHPPPIALAELTARLEALRPGGRRVSLLRLTADEADELIRAGVEPLP